MILIYIDKQSNAFSYICGVLLEDIEDGFSITYDWQQFISHSGPAICYDRINRSDHAINLMPAVDIWQNGEPKRLALGLNDSADVQYIFPTSGDLNFDVFAASFFVISRYEEYLPYDEDDIGRYTAECSKSSSGNLYKRPVVDIWRDVLWNMLVKKWPQLARKQRAFEKLATIDVDSAFAYCHKGLSRTLGGFARDFSRGDWKNMTNRIRCLTGSAGDPFKTYDYITSHIETSKIDLIFFFLLADFTKFDINVTHRSEELRKLIRELSRKYIIGIHPGIASHSSITRLQMEKQRLEEITGKICHASRQHYLKVNLPQTYRRLIEAGITDDYSMGYADDTGFRAGTCRPFKWFDLSNNTVTPLTVHSVMAMDATLNSYLNLTADEAIEHCSALMNEVKNVNGTFISIWHNDTLAERGIWKGWRRVWESINS